jgi:hypothetical protein
MNSNLNRGAGRVTLRAFVIFIHENRIRFAKMPK